jgi:hypothetical protein
VCNRSQQLASHHANTYVLPRYFGRAKELPGVKELFQSKKKEQDEENVAQNFYKKFTNQGPAYFGDLDEQDGQLLAYERAAEDEGPFCPALLHFHISSLMPLSFSCFYDAQNGKTHTPTYEKPSVYLKTSRYPNSPAPRQGPR